MAWSCEHSLLSFPFCNLGAAVLACPCYGGCKNHRWWKCWHGRYWAKRPMIRSWSEDLLMSCNSRLKLLLTWVGDVAILFILGPPCADIQMRSPSPSPVFLSGTCLFNLPIPCIACLDMFSLHSVFWCFFVPRWHHPMVATIKVRPVVRNHHGSNFPGTYETQHYTSNHAEIS